jgi:hypothetical protein
MTDVLMREIVCRDCLCRTRQPYLTLEPVIWLQAMSSEDGTYINYACPLCNKLTRSRIQSEAKIQDIDLTKFPDDLTVYIVFLRCAGIDCESPVILLAPVKKEVTDAELMTHIRENWTNRGAACSKGHVPSYPFEGRVWKQLESEHR